MRQDPRQPGPRELARGARRAEAERLERKQQVRTLLVLALLAMLFSIVRVGAARVFTTGWLRLW